MAQLRVVETKHKEPPYARNTRVRGWKFVLDYERINQSDTWALSPPDMRPWLLMLWHTAWQQVPAGSFSDDDRVIAAKIGMDYRLFAAHKDILMRGWERYSDGRLYHPVIVEQVLNYQETSKKEAERKAAWRAKQKQEDAVDVPRDRHGTDAGVTTPEPEPEPKNPFVLPDGSTCGSAAPTHPPYQRIVDLYHEKLPMLRTVAKLSAARKQAIRGRWTDGLPDLDAWAEYFDIVAESSFLTGKAPANGRRKPWQADFDWLIKESNTLKVFEGRYDD